VVKAIAASSYVVSSIRGVTNVVHTSTGWVTCPVDAVGSICQHYETLLASTIADLRISPVFSWINACPVTLGEEVVAHHTVCTAVALHPPRGKSGNECGPSDSGIG